jgi:hypothetical protein
MVAYLGSLCYSASQIAFWMGAILLTVGLALLIFRFVARKGARNGALFYIGALLAALGMLCIIAYLALPTVIGRLVGIDNYPVQNCNPSPAVNQTLPYCGKEYCDKSGPYSNRTDCACSAPL